MSSTAVNATSLLRMGAAISSNRCLTRHCPRRGVCIARRPLLQRFVSERFVISKQANSVTRVPSHGASMP
jgi:hypothetical protein